jgi:hypothetical protein
MIPVAGSRKFSAGTDTVRVRMKVRLSIGFHSGVDLVIETKNKIVQVVENAK